MKATIWHNPRCSKSRETLAILEGAPGVDVEVVNYLDTPPSRVELSRLYQRAGMTPRDGLRAGEPVAKDLKLAEAPDDTILDAMVAHPILIERPLVETDKGVRLGRPPEKVREIL
jgi:arsenate reductase